MRYKILGIMTTAMVFTACGEKLSFTGMNLDEGRLNIPSIDLPSVLAPFQTVKGQCSSDGQKVLSCLSCKSEVAVPARPVISRKAQELVDIMAAACAVANKSDAAGYVAPSKDQIFNRVIQCSESAYPNTSFINTQSQTIQALLYSAEAQQAAFGGLYYNAASTDFETYFGLEIGEARNLFCRGQGGLGSHGVYPKEYYDSLYSGAYYSLPGFWRDAQGIRNNLRSCMEQSRLNRNVNIPQPTPGMTCEYEVVQGEGNSLLFEKAQTWLDQGLQVYYEGANQCGQASNLDHLYDYRGSLKFAVTRCH